MGAKVTLIIIAVAYAVVLAYAVYVTVLLGQPQIQAASDRICVPLYDRTGLECCQ